MTTSLLNRQLANITETLIRANERHEAGLRDAVNRTANPTPVVCNHSSKKAVLITPRPEDEDLKGAARVGQSEDFSKEQHVLPSGDNASDTDGEYNLQSMLKELERQKPGTCGLNTESEPPEFANPEHADMDRSSTITNPNGTVGESPKEKVEELSRCWAVKGSGTGHETTDFNDSKAMLADIKQDKQASGLCTHDDGEFDLDVACGRRAAIQSPSHSLAPQPTLQANGTMPACYADLINHQDSVPTIAATSGPEITPYAVALTLESTGCQWERVKDWTLYLFGSGMKHRTKHERERITPEEKETPNVTSTYPPDEEKNQFARRLVLSNLAADTDQESIYVFLAKYKQNIRKVTLLSERDPVTRTRTAYVDMCSRRSAVRASFEFGNIFGLVVKIKLAEE